MNLPFKVICLNDSNKPNDIPSSKWVKKGHIYTVIKVDILNMQNKQIGFQLEEIDLSDCFPYLYFISSRFGIPTQDTITYKKEIEELVDL